MARQLLLQGLGVRLHQRAVLVAEPFRHHGNLHAAFQILEARGIGEREVQFRGVQYVKHDHVVTPEPQRPDSFGHGLRLLVEVRNHHQKAAPPEELGQLLHGRQELACPHRHQFVERVQHHFHVLGRGRHMFTDVVVERHQAHAIALPVHEVGQTPGEDPGVLELRDTPRAEVHGLRHVEQHREVRVRVRLVLLHVEALGAGKHAPVNPAHVVAGHVPAVLGEIYRGAVERRFVQSVDEAVDDRLGNQFEIANAREDARVYEPGAGNRRRGLHVTFRTWARAPVPRACPRSCPRSHLPTARGSS